MPNLSYKNAADLVREAWNQVDELQEAYEAALERVEELQAELQEATDRIDDLEKELAATGVPSND